MAEPFPSPLPRREVYAYAGWCNGPGNARGWRSMLEFVRGTNSRPHSWISVYSAAGGEIAVRHWRWGMVKWGFGVREVGR